MPTEPLNKPSRPNEGEDSATYASGRTSWLHSPVLSGFLAVVVAGAGVWGALSQAQSNQRGDDNDALRGTVASLERQNQDLVKQNAALGKEVTQLRDAASAQPSASRSTPAMPPVSTDDPANWRVPRELWGTWAGVATSSSGTYRVTISITLNGDGLGKGSQAGTAKFIRNNNKDCLMRLYLADLRIDNSTMVSPDAGTQQGDCGSLYNPYIVSLRPDGRLDIAGNEVAGALTKVS